MVQRVQHAGCDILSSAEIGMGTGKQKTSREKHLVPENFEPVPYREAHQADAAEAAQITLRKGEWNKGIRNRADVTLLRQVLELLR